MCIMLTIEQYICNSYVVGIVNVYISTIEQSTGYIGRYILVN